MTARPAGSRRVGGERGSATVLVVAAMLLVAVLLLVLMVVMALMAAQVRASQAADLAALAGAEKAWFGDDAACGEAARIADAQGARVERCSWEGLDVQVHVVVTTALPDLRALNGRGALELRAVARAGPPTEWDLAAGPAGG